MNKRILILAMTVFTLVVMTLPMIPTAQACRWRRPTETYDDLQIWGSIVPDGPAEVWKWRNIQYGRYTAHSEAVDYLTGELTGFHMIAIMWNGTYPPAVCDTILYGHATFDVCYRINLDTMKGVAHLKTVITPGTWNIDGSEFYPGDGAFVGHKLHTGDLVLDENGTIPWDGWMTGTWTGHTLLRGTGEYAGWTIVQYMSSSGVGKGYLTKPID